MELYTPVQAVGRRAAQFVSAEEAVGVVQPHDRVYVQGAAMTPTLLLSALAARAKSLTDVEILQMHTEGRAPYTDPKHEGTFSTNACFVSPNVRNAINGRMGSYVPVFLGEAHLLFQSGIMPIDVAFVHVSPPDRHGVCSLGTSVDATLAATRAAKVVVAQLNPQVPRTHGDGFLHMSEIDMFVECSMPLHQMPMPIATDIEARIGEHVASLVEDGATLQLGIGGIPNAVLSHLGHHKRLGLHTEMFSDGVMPLVEKGVITGEEKKVKPGKLVTTFVAGTKALYRFVDDNPMLDLKESAFTNDPAIIKQNPKVTAINSAIEIDLTGQVCAESIGDYQYSGVGGQVDFLRGAALSKRGKAIIAMPSTTKMGLSKIVPQLRPGATVTTSRAHVHYVATEYGVVNLFGKNLKQRAQALASIAHPDHRERLHQLAHERFQK